MGCIGRPLLAQALILLVPLLPRVRGQDPTEKYNGVCPHYTYENVEAARLIEEGVPIYDGIRKNQTHFFFYENRNLSTQLRHHFHRNLILNLEPCRGTVYLFVWKTRQCFPNPYSCIDLTEGEEIRNPGMCDWTYFHSEIDGSLDGTQTLFELPFTATRWYLAVFAPENAEYTLTVLADTGWLPRPGSYGRVYASQSRELEVDLMWDVATYSPPDYTTTKQYWVYSVMLVEDDVRTNPLVFLKKSKILNTVCGLHNNTEQEYSIVQASQCFGGSCNATIKGVVTGWRYAFNVVAESEAGLYSAYAGIILRTDWNVERIATSDKTLEVVGAVSGSVIGMSIIVYFLLLKLHGSSKSSGG